MSKLVRLILDIKGRLVPTIASSAITISSADALYGGVIVHNSGAGAATTYVLPPALPGMRVTGVVKAAQELRLDPSGTETIALPSSGVQGAGGKYLTGDAVGESVTLACLIAGTWDHIGPIDGTWTAEG